MTARNTPSAPRAGAVSAVSEERVRELRWEHGDYRRTSIMPHSTMRVGDFLDICDELLRLRAEVEDTMRIAELERVLRAWVECYSHCNSDELDALARRSCALLRPPSPTGERT